MSKEAMKLALEALRFGLHVGFDESSESQIKKGGKAFDQHNKAITAIKQALAAPVQQPVVCDGDFPEGFDESIGIPAQALRQANAALCEVTNNRMWDVPALAERMMLFRTYTTPPAAQPAPVQEPVGNWIWSWIMGWCKRNGIAPATQDSLFAMVEDARNKFATSPAQPADTLTDGVLKITMQIGEIEVSRLLSLDVIRTSNAPEVERHSRQAWLDLQKASHGIAEKGQP